MAALLKATRQRLAGAEDDWTLERWHEELVHLRTLSVRHQLALHREDPSVIDLKDGSVGVLRWPTVVRVDPPNEAWRLGKSYPPIGDTIDGPSLVYPERPDEHIPLKSCGRLLPWSQTPALIVSLDATDEDIRAAVNEALRDHAAQQRHARPALAHRRTRAAPSKSFNDPKRHTFKRWRIYKISELAELLAWKARLPQVERKKYPHHVLGSWIDIVDFTAQKTSGCVEDTVGRYCLHTCDTGRTA